MQTRFKAITASIGFFLLRLNEALATSVKVTESPDGTKTTETVTHYANTTPWDTTVIVLGILIGMAVIWLGYRLLTKGAPKAHDAANAELEFNLADKTIRAKNVTEGVLVVLLGALVIIAALWWAGGRGNNTSVETRPPLTAN